ncbi:MAG: 3-oxoacyl-[acyl-carrier-protein] reductase [Victivallales bacterium]|nr:3-oxoacyl-[acyl-carrier-protein] reductase [Victivallales bacterium]
MTECKQDKVALVTGGSRGIGFAVCERLAAAGVSVAVASRSEKGAADAAEKLSATFGIVSKGYSVDVSDTQAVEAMVTAVLADFGKIDMLVNDAGITRDGLLMRMKEADWDDVLAVNLKGVFNVTRAVSKAMVRARSGRIVNISSIVGLRGNAGQCNYAASKAGVIGFSKSLAKEIAGRGITVNVIAPGFIDTDMTASLTQEQQDGIKTQIPMGRIGLTQEVAAAVAFLLSDDAAYITGQVLSIDGGLAM